MNDYVKYSFIETNTDDDLTYVSGIDLLPILKELNVKKGIEIGVDEGRTSNYFLSNLPELTLFGIDPYEGYVDWNGNNLDQNGRNYTLEKAKNRLNKYGDRYVLHQLKSDDAVSLLEDDYDFIFIDGLHEYEQLKKDCANYFPKIRKGGVFSGHDYTTIVGVKNAVDEFAKEVGATITHLPNRDVWYWIKG